MIRSATNYPEHLMLVTVPDNTLRPGLLQKEVAEALGCSRRTLTNWLRAGYGPQPIRVGNNLLYNPADVQAFAAGAR